MLIENKSHLTTCSGVSAEFVASVLAHELPVRADDDCVRFMTLEKISSRWVHSNRDFVFIFLSSSPSFVRSFGTRTAVARRRCAQSNDTRRVRTQRETRCVRLFIKRCSVVRFTSHHHPITHSSKPYPCVCGQSACRCGCGARRRIGALVAPSNAIQSCFVVSCCLLVLCVVGVFGFRVCEVRATDLVFRCLFCKRLSKQKTTNFFAFVIGSEWMRQRLQGDALNRYG